MPSIRGVASTTTGTAATAVGTVPVGSVVGDLLCFALAVDTAATITAPSGFTLNRRLATADQVLETYLRVVDGTEAASYKWTFASNDFCGSMFLVKDAIASVVPHKENGQTNAGGTTVTAPSLTTTIDGCLLIGFFAGDVSVPGTTTYTSGMTTEITDISTASWTNLSIYTEAQVSQGSTGTKTATASVTQTNGSMGQLLAFAPAVVSGAVVNKPRIRPGPPSGPQQVAWMQRPQLATDIPVSSINATFTVTESDDTILSGTTIGVAGSVLVTEASDTILSGTSVASNLSLQVTESSDSILSNTGVGVSGTLAVTETSDTIVSGTTIGVGLSLQVTESADTIVSSTTSTISLSAAITEAADTIVSGSSIAIAASLQVTTEASDTIVSGATVSSVAGINVSLDVTESDDSVLSGTTSTLSGSVAVTEDGDSIAAFLDTGNPAIVVSAAGPIPGAGRGRKLRILPDGTRLYATEDEVRKILTHFYKPKSLDDVKLLPKKVQQKFREQPVEIELVQFDKHVPKFYELKTEKRLAQGDYSLFLKALRRKEEEEFLYLVMEML